MKKQSTFVDNNKMMMWNMMMCGMMMRNIMNFRAFLYCQSGNNIAL